MTSEQEVIHRRNRLAAKLIEEAWKVVRGVKLENRGFPVGGLEASLRAIDAELGISREDDARKAPCGSSDFRVLRKDMEIDRDYVLIRKGYPEVPFKYIGLGEFGIGIGSNPSKIKILVGGKVEEWFWADLGLEPFRSGCPDEWWGPNWVRRADFDDRDIDVIMKYWDSPGDDGGVENPLFLPTDWGKH